MKKRASKGPAVVLRKRALDIPDVIRQEAQSLNNTRITCDISRGGQIYTALQISREEWDRYSPFFGKSLLPNSDIDMSNVEKGKDIARFKNELATALRYCGYNNPQTLKMLVDGSHVTGIPIKVWHQGQNGFAKVLNVGKNKVLPVVLVGDAVLGVHYFSGAGINFGFLGVDILIDYFHSHLEDAIFSDQIAAMTSAVVNDYNEEYYDLVRPESNMHGVWVSEKVYSIDPNYKCTKSEEELKKELYSGLKLSKEFVETCSRTALCYLNYKPLLESPEI